MLHNKTYLDGPRADCTANAPFSTKACLAVAGYTLTDERRGCDRLILRDGVEIGWFDHIAARKLPGMAEALDRVATAIAA